MPKSEQTTHTASVSKLHVVLARKAASGMLNRVEDWVTCCSRAASTTYLEGSKYDVLIVCT
jgi:hypothetical protein